MLSNEDSKRITIIHKDEILEVLFDITLFEELSKTNWSWRCGYAGRKRRKSDPIGGTWIHFHHEVLRLNGVVIPEGLMVDHINRNRLDNRLENLRLVTRSENSKNVSEQECLRRRDRIKELTELSAQAERSEKQKSASKNNAKRLLASGLHSHIGKDHIASKKVLDKATGVLYDNIRIAAEALGYVYSTLRNRLNGNLKNNTTLVFYTEV